jgi:hypothetical protein
VVCREKISPILPFLVPINRPAKTKQKMRLFLSVSFCNTSAKAANLHFLVQKVTIMLQTQG